MSKNPLALKVAAPYARALFDFVKETGTFFEVTSDIQNIQGLLFKSRELFKCLQNPVISAQAKQEILIKVVGKKNEPGNSSVFSYFNKTKSYQFITNNNL